MWHVAYYNFNLFISRETLALALSAAETLMKKLQPQCLQSNKEEKLREGRKISLFLLSLRCMLLCVAATSSFTHMSSHVVISLSP